MSGPDPATAAGIRLRFMEHVRHSAIVGIAGVITGLIIGGGGGRILMRIAAVAAPERVIGATTENGNRIGDITLGGTLGLLVFGGVLLGLLGAIAYLISEPWLTWARRWRGAVFGGFLLAIGSTAALNSENFDFFIVGNQGLNVGMFVALYLGFGALMVPIVDRLERTLPPVDPERAFAGGWGYIVLVAFGAQFVLAFFVQFFLDDANGGPPPVLTGLLLIGLAIASLAVLVKRISLRPLPGFVNLAGYGFLAAAIAVGGTRAIDDIVTILSR